MLFPIIALVVGFVLLAWSADRFVFGAATVARNLGVSPLIVGLTIVGFGTSAPELVIAAFAAWDGVPDLAIGNAVGSNVANVGLVIGLGTLIAPLTVRSQILKREYPVMLAAMLFALALMLDHELSRLDGALLLVALLGLIAWTVRIGLRERTDTFAKTMDLTPADPLDSEYTKELAIRVGTRTAMAWLLVGLVVLSASSRLLVWGATEIAHVFGVSDLIIGLTIVAIGTSLPEVATAVASGFKGEDDIAVGNVVGSNMFNMLGVLGLPVVMHPTAISNDLLIRDMPVMFTMSVILLFMAFPRRGGARITRAHGLILLALYVGYGALLARAVT